MIQSEADTRLTETLTYLFTAHEIGESDLL